MLLAFVRHPNTTLSKDALIAAGWDDVAVTDNSLEQAISALRRALGETPDGHPYIQTVARQGYRFTVDVVSAVQRESDEGLDALLAPHRAWVEGLAGLETLDRDRVTAAREAFHRAVASAPDYAPAHIGLANACALRFESTRAHETPDAAALRDALQHAREACRLEPQLAEAWATLGFVQHRIGEFQEAIAACRRAVALEPDNWRHSLRLAFVSWGEDRLRAADRTLRLLPGLALAHWLAATVHVARQAFDRAERELDAGVTAQNEQGGEASRFSSVGLHWLRGLLYFYRDDDAAAGAAFERELSTGQTTHLYADECRANTWYALGALALHHKQGGKADRAFENALVHVAGHPFALAALASRSARDARASVDALLQARLTLLRAHAPADAAMTAAIRARADISAETAAEMVSETLVQTPAIGAAWILPVEPLLRPTTDAAWSHALAILRSRSA